MANNLSSAAGGGKERISIPMAILLVGTAVLFDATQDAALFANALPGIGTAIDFLVSWYMAFVAAITFFVWFALLGVNYAGKGAARKMLISLGTIIVELIPLIDALPAITFGVIALIVQTRIEDKGITGPELISTLSGTRGKARGAGLRPSYERPQAAEAGYSGRIATGSGTGAKITASQSEPVRNPAQEERAVSGLRAASAQKSVPQSASEAMPRQPNRPLPANDNEEEEFREAA